jgi:hypothetical protein
MEPHALVILHQGNKAGCRADDCVRDVSGRLTVIGRGSLADGHRLAKRPLPACGIFLAEQML